MPCNRTAKDGTRTPDPWNSDTLQTELQRRSDDELTQSLRQSEVLLKENKKKIGSRFFSLTSTVNEFVDQPSYYLLFPSFCEACNKCFCRTWWGSSDGILRISAFIPYSSNLFCNNSEKTKPCVFHFICNFKTFEMFWKFASHLCRSINYYMWQL